MLEPQIKSGEKISFRDFNLSRGDLILGVKKKENEIIFPVIVSTFYEYWRDRDNAFLASEIRCLFPNEADLPFPLILERFENDFGYFNTTSNNFFLFTNNLDYYLGLGNVFQVLNEIKGLENHALYFALSFYNKKRN